MKSQFTITPFWDSRVMDTKSKESRILLTINLNRQQFRLSLKLKATKDDFEKAMFERSLNEDQRSLRKSIGDYVAKAEMIFDKLPSITKESFVKLFKSETDLVLSNKTDVFFFYEDMMKVAEKEGRISTALNYRDCMRSLKSYKSSVYFEDIDERWLKAYKTHLLSLGNSDSTVSIRLRCLRTMFNVAIKGKFIAEKHYPFKDFPIGCSVKSKEALYPVQLKQLWDYKPDTLRKSRAKAYFFFCYLCNGMNFKDMAYLKWKQIKGDILTFVREKTKLTTTSGSKEIRVYLNDEIRQIIKTWRTEGKADDYVFPIVSKYKTGALKEKARYRIKKVTNTSLSEIGKELGFKVHLCLNLARHSFATTLKLNGTPTSFIGDAFGHTNSKTTEHYVKSLPDENLKSISKSLLHFTKAV